LLEIGLQDISDLINKKPLQELLKTALPHQTKNIESFDTHSYYFFLNELEKKLQEELLKSIEGNNQDSRNLEQAAEIISKANRVNEEIPKENIVTHDASPKGK
jgi:DNA-binding protein Fis